jgi:hypothetical protein
MDKARAYTVTTRNADFHSKASTYLDKKLKVILAWKAVLLTPMANEKNL